MNDGRCVDDYVKLKQIILLVLRHGFSVSSPNFVVGLCFCLVSTYKTGFVVC
jgi:hypothetical protein